MSETPIPNPSEPVEPLDIKPVLENLQPSLNEIVVDFIKNELKVTDPQQAEILRVTVVDFITSNLEKVGKEILRVTHPRNFNLWVLNMQIPRTFSVYIKRMLHDDRLWTKIAGEQHYEIQEPLAPRQEVIEHIIHGQVK